MDPKGQRGHGPSQKAAFPIANDYAKKLVMKKAIE